MTERVLVLCATSKTGRNVSRALLEAGFEVYGTTRSTKPLPFGTAIKADYTNSDDLDQAFKECKPQFVFGNPTLCEELGETIIDTIVRAKVEHLVWCSIGWARNAPEKVTHFHALEKVATMVKNSGIASYSIIEPAAYFENIDDPGILSSWDELNF